MDLYGVYSWHLSFICASAATSQRFLFQMESGQTASQPATNHFSESFRAHHSNSHQAATNRTSSRKRPRLNLVRSLICPSARSAARPFTMYTLCLFAIHSALSFGSLVVQVHQTSRTVVVKVSVRAINNTGVILSTFPILLATTAVAASSLLLESSSASE